MVVTMIWTVLDENNLEKSKKDNPLSFACLFVSSHRLY